MGKKISELTTTATPSSAAYVPIAHNGENYKVTVANLRPALGSGYNTIQGADQVPAARESVIEVLGATVSEGTEKTVIDHRITLPEYETLGDEATLSNVKELSEIVPRLESRVFDRVTKNPAVIGSDGLNYVLKVTHTATVDDEPITGANWATYWERGGRDGVPWVVGTTYEEDNIDVAPTASQTRVIFIGDSNTMTQASALRESVGTYFSQVLQSQLREYNFYIINQGVGGNDSSDLVERYTRDVELRYVPGARNILVICESRNSVVNGIPTNTYYANLEGMIDDFQALGGEVLVCLYPPVANATHNTGIQANNTKISDENALRATPFTIIDLNSAVSADGVNWDTPSYTDGLHWTTTGHAFIASIIRPYLLSADTGVNHHDALYDAGLTFTDDQLKITKGFRSEKTITGSSVNLPNYFLCNLYDSITGISYGLTSELSLYSDFDSTSQSTGAVSTVIKRHDHDEGAMTGLLARVTSIVPVAGTIDEVKALSAVNVIGAGTTVTTIYGIYSQPNTNAGGTLGDVYGAYILGAAGTVTGTEYGVVYAGTGASSFGGALSVTGNFHTTGEIAAYYTTSIRSRLVSDTSQGSLELYYGTNKLTQQYQTSQDKLVSWRSTSITSVAINLDSVATVVQGGSNDIGSTYHTHGQYTALDSTTVSKVVASDGSPDALVADATGNLTMAGNLTGPEAGYTLGVTASTTGAGGTITVQAGNNLAGTDINGGSLDAIPGRSTGLGMSHIQLRRRNRQASTGTTNNGLPYPAIFIPSQKHLPTSHAVTGLFEIAVADLFAGGFTISYSVICKNATDEQCLSGMVNCSIVRKSSTVTSTISSVLGEVHAETTSTTDTTAVWSIVADTGNNKVTVSVDATGGLSSITQLYIVYTIFNNGLALITQL